MSALIPWEEARRRVLDGVEPLAPCTLGVTDALGHSLAEDIRAPEAMPPFDNSAMDGFAVRAADVAGASQESPVVLNVVGEVPAGQGEPGAIGPGSAARIMTGAPLPAG